MKRFFVAFILMIVGFAASADVTRTTYKVPGVGDAVIEYDTSNKGAEYRKIDVLANQARLSQFYSKLCYIDVSEIYYTKPSSEEDTDLAKFVYKLTKDYGWTVTTVDNVKFCHHIMSDGTIAEFSIVLGQKH